MSNVGQGYLEKAPCFVWKLHCKYIATMWIIATNLTPIGVTPHLKQNTRNHYGCLTGQTGMFVTQETCRFSIADFLADCKSNKLVEDCS